ncbi:MAG: trimethylamine methyltransferase family protein [Kiloniellales bacterium]|nr:trimethylamine methyltransferase family protein [Kiloniellales bacterium]
MAASAARRRREVTENPSPARRAGRRARRERAPVTGPAYITRRIPTYELVSEEGLALIEAQAERILKEIGIEFRGDEEALRLFKAAGAEVSGPRVRFEPGQVRALCSTAPRQFTQVARNPARSVVIGGDHTVFSPAYGAPFVRDLEGGRRYGAIQDFANFVKLAYLSPWLHHSGGTICEPVDIPVNKRHLDMVYAHLRWSDKAFMGSVTAPERAADSIEMCRILFGADVVDETCVILGNINVNSPLVYDDVMSGVLRTYAAANQATIVVPFILGGAMGPVTPAGTIAQAHAEALVGVALTQLVRPGAPAIYGNFLSSMSLRSGAPTFGTPEPALAYIAVGQLARRAGLPVRVGGALTASKVADGQALQESADSMMPAILAGANFILHSAGWLEGGLSMGYEKFVLDCDRLGMLHVFMKGLALDENAFAMAAFHETGPGAHFLGTAHTMANYETAYYEPPLADCKSFEQWRDEGEKDSLQRASERWRELLAGYEAPALDPGIDEALKAFIARRKGSLPDMWH